MNAALAGLPSAEVVRSDLLAQVTGSVDLIVANPPYMRDERHRVYRDAEPHVAQRALPKDTARRETRPVAPEEARLALCTGDAFTMASRSNRSKKPKSAPTALLIKQHDKVKAIFAQLERGRPPLEPALVELANNLAAHMAIEQELYYPAVKKVDEDLVLESYEEHSLAELGLKRLLATAPDDESFEARVTAVKELIEHHVEEEEGDLFPEVDKKLGKDVLVALGKQMKARFAEVLAAGFTASVPAGFGKTSADVSKK